MRQLACRRPGPTRPGGDSTSTIRRFVPLRRKRSSSVSSASESGCRATGAPRGAPRRIASQPRVDVRARRDAHQPGVVPGWIRPICPVESDVRRDDAEQTARHCPRQEGDVHLPGQASRRSSHDARGRRARGRGAGPPAASRRAATLQIRPGRDAVEPDRPDSQRLPSPSTSAAGSRPRTSDPGAAR